MTENNIEENDSFDREKGIEAIIKLQAFVGIDEPRDRAARNWDAMSNLEKANTMNAFNIFFEKE